MALSAWSLTLGGSALLEACAVPHPHPKRRFDSRGPVYPPSRAPTLKASIITGSFQGNAQAYQSSLASEPYLVLAALLVIYIMLGVLLRSPADNSVDIAVGRPWCAFNALAAWLRRGRRASAEPGDDALHNSLRLSVPRQAQHLAFTKAGACGKPCGVRPVISHSLACPF
jgi:hypothetical protein